MARPAPDSPGKTPSAAQPSGPTLPPEHNPALDLLRALAISLVFVYHWRVFVGPEPALGWLGDTGWTGVDLFFVLSGCLIGRQVFTPTTASAPRWVAVFWARRALRTWPAYAVVLVVYLLWPAELGGKTPPPWWRFATFTQNIGLQPGAAFSHAWSLCIEEQFYLALPLVVVLARQLGRRPWQAWALLVALLALGVGARTALWLKFGREAAGRMALYYPWIYYSTLCRFDEFLPGLAVALLQARHPALWQRLMAHGRSLLLAGLVGTGAMGWAAHEWLYIDGEGYGGFMTIAGYSLLAIAFGLLVLAAHSPASGLMHLRLPGVATLARWSYTLYLSHKAVAHLLKGPLAQAGVAPWPGFALTVLAALAVAALLHHAVEAPGLALRARWFPPMPRSAR